MTDIVDRAALNEERHRAAALARARQRPVTGQRIDEHGHVRCLGCACIIPAKRIAAAPFAARCVECEADHERGHQ